MKHISHPCADNHPAHLTLGIVAQVSPVSQVLIETYENGDPQLRSDIHLLLHQEKLAQLGDRAAAAYIDSMQQGSYPSLYPDGVTDDQIMQTIKSKYIQSPSELSGWMEHLKELAISEVDKVQVSNCTSSAKAAEAAETAPADAQSSKTD